MAKKANEQVDSELQKLIEKNARRDYNTMRRRLLQIINGKIVDIKLDRQGNVVEIGPTNAVIVAACKALKELQQDKVIGAKKDKPQEKIPFDPVEEILKIHKLKEAELIKSGKVVPIDGPAVNHK